MSFRTLRQPALALVALALSLGPYAAVAATVSQVSPGLFRSVAPANGPRQFYRIRR